MDTGSKGGMVPRGGGKNDGGPLGTARPPISVKPFVALCFVDTKLAGPAEAERCDWSRRYRSSSSGVRLRT